MPMSRRMARFNRAVTNPLLRRIALWMPGFGVVHHTGRRSGRTYRTPVNVLRRADGYLIALGYGSDADWVRNVLSARRCDLRTRGRVEHLVEPHLYVDPERATLPAVVRLILRLNNVDEFLALKLAVRPVA